MFSFDGGSLVSETKHSRFYWGYLIFKTFFFFGAGIIFSIERKGIERTFWEFHVTKFLLKLMEEKVIFFIVNNLKNNPDGGDGESMLILVL